MKNTLKKIYAELRKLNHKIACNLFGNKDYSKFVIISTSRTGSTLLMALLNNHPEVICEGEIFKDLQGKTCKQIWKSLYSKKPKKIKQVGFKLFYNHPRNNDNAIWDILKHDRNIKIIHLIRKNSMRVFISQRIGLKTKQWSENKFRPHGLKLDDKRVSIDVEECKKAIEKIDNYVDDTRSSFKKHSYTEVYYEDLAKNKKDVIKRLEAFLHVSHQTVEVPNKKQNPEKIEDLVENYQEVNSYFKGTKWRFMLKES